MGKKPTDYSLTNSSKQMFTTNFFIILLGLLAIGSPTWIPRSHQWTQDEKAMLPQKSQELQKEQIRGSFGADEPRSPQEAEDRKLLNPLVKEYDEPSTECIKQALIWLLEQNITWTKTSRSGRRRSRRSAGAFDKRD